MAKKIIFHRKDNKRKKFGTTDYSKKSAFEKQKGQNWRYYTVIAKHDRTYRTIQYKNKIREFRNNNTIQTHTHKNNKNN